jgi:hypothetical protein
MERLAVRPVLVDSKLVHPAGVPPSRDLARLHELVKAEAIRQGGVCGIRLYVERSNQTAQQDYRQLGMRPCSYQMYEQVLPE